MIGRGKARRIKSCRRGARRIYWLGLGLGLVVFTCGCQSLVTGRQQSVSGAAQKALLERAVAPEEAGLRVFERGGQQSVRWREMAMPERAVQVRLLGTGSAQSVQPVVAARVNSGPALRMVVDTGAPVTLIDVRSALANQVVVVQPERLRNCFQGLGGEEEVWFGVARQMTVGPELALRTVFLAIRPAQYQRRLAGFIPVASWDGSALGMSSLGNFAFLTLDYPERRAVFSYREYFPGPAGRVVAQAAFQLESGQIRVPLVLAGREVEALVDTGNDAALMVNAKLVRDLGWEKLAESGKKELYVGLGGDVALRSFAAPAFELGGVSFDGVIATRGPEEFGVVLGSGFFHRYRLTLDFRRKKLWLEAPQSASR